MVVSRREDNAQRIAALDEQAEALGLRRGMGVADARAMHPFIDIVEADGKADRRLLESLADWCDRYTPLVALDDDNDDSIGLFLDITGCTHLFSGEKRLIDDMTTRFLHQGFDARIGIASTVGAAWAAAHITGRAIIDPGEEAAFLAPLPLAALRIGAAIRNRLESVGLRTTGAIMATPRAPLARRFGAALLWRLDQTLGHLDEAVSPRLPVAPLSVDRHLAEPVTQLDDIERLVAALSITLKADLERRGEGARALALTLFRVDGAVSRICVGTSHPLREPLMIQKLFHERLAALTQDFDAGYGFDLARLSVPSSEPFEVEQTDLAEKSEQNEPDLCLFIDRLRARLGHDAILKPIAVKSHVPERAITHFPFDIGYEPNKAQADNAEYRSQRERPIRLLRPPEPVHVPATEIPDGPPLNFRWRRTFYRVARSEGPERIAPEWWRSIKDEPTRDYYRVEDADGRRYWLYRQGLYETGKPAPRWFMQGIFA
ncbi:DNA repair protein [Pseudaminobacter manganicus]|uniref:DNA repair protein n=1 Tax=Manganibacter manganicus TaxID=1873176 RepID=A0A1V8RVQ5_9HYPH|nr:DNA repair protein [Pseudaminobacter manganicus]